MSCMGVKKKEEEKKKQYELIVFLLGVSYKFLIRIVWQAVIGRKAFPSTCNTM